MIELGVVIILLAAVGVYCGIASIVLAFAPEEYPHADYHKDDPEYGNMKEGKNEKKS